MNQALKKTAQFVRDILQMSSYAADLVGAIVVESTVLSSLQAISDGSFAITVDGMAQDVTGLDFTSILSLDDAVTVINGTMTDATAVYSDNQFAIGSDTTGRTSTLSYLSAAASGTFIGALVGLTELTAESLSQGGYGEELIKIGRIDWELVDFNNDYVAVDSISPATRVSSGEKFDENGWLISYFEKWRTPVVISFYGDNAYTYADKLRLMLKSELAFELQEELGVAIYAATSVLDVKNLTGRTYNNRIDLNLNVELSIATDVSTSTLDEAQTSILFNK